MQSLRRVVSTVEDERLLNLRHLENQGLFIQMTKFRGWSRVLLTRLLRVIIVARLIDQSRPDTSPLSHTRTFEPKPSLGKD
jgi:hypothetical protein